MFHFHIVWTVIWAVTLLPWHHTSSYFHVVCLETSQMMKPSILVTMLPALTIFTVTAFHMLGHSLDGLRVWSFARYDIVLSAPSLAVSVPYDLQWPLFDAVMSINGTIRQKTEICVGDVGRHPDVMVIDRTSKIKYTGRFYSRVFLTKHMIINIRIRSQAAIWDDIDPLSYLQVATLTHIPGGNLPSLIVSKMHVFTYGKKSICYDATEMMWNSLQLISLTGTRLCRQQLLAVIYQLVVDVCLSPL